MRVTIGIRARSRQQNHLFRRDSDQIPANLFKLAKMAGTRSVVTAGASNSGNNGTSTVDTAEMMIQFQQMLDAFKNEFTGKIDALQHDVNLKFQYVKVLVVPGSYSMEE